MLVALLAAASGGGCRRDRKYAPAAPAGLVVSGADASLPLTGKTLRIAMIAKSSSNPSFLSARTGAEDRARELSLQVGAPIEIDWLTPPQDDAQVQAQRILQAVNDRVDAILISCSDDLKVSQAINDAVARGVAVMTFDSDAPASQRFSFCGVDDFEVGRRLLAEMAALLAATAPVGGATAPSTDHAGGKAAPAKVAILGGNRSAPNLRRRVQGVMSEAARHPELKMVGTFFHVETAQEASAEVLRTSSTYPDLAGWVMVGGWPLYNKTLLSELEGDARRSTLYKIVAVNALPPQLVYVEKGYVPVLLAQPTYLWGAIGVDAIVKKLLLKQPVPERIPMDLVRVTTGNLGTWARQLKAWGFGDVPDEYLRLK